MMIKKVPYFSKQMDWKQTGFPNKANYMNWNSDICGVYCLKMAGDYFGKTNQISIWKLLEVCQKNNGFKIVNGNRIGIFHRALAKTARDFGLGGRVIKKFDLIKIKKEICKGNLAILSINKNKINPKFSGGHLVLIVGFNSTENDFIINDPDPILAKNGDCVQINEANLKAISNQRGILIKSKRVMFGD